MDKEKYLKERGYDCRQILTFFYNNPENQKKLITNHPEFSDIVFEPVEESDVSKFIDRIYNIVKR